MEIVFERRATDTHSRRKRHKKRSRRKEREPNSPTIITIESDSDHINHTEASGPSEANAQPQANPETEANSNAADLPNQFTDDEMNSVINVHTAEDPPAEDNERVSDVSDHTVDYQEHLA